MIDEQSFLDAEGCKYPCTDCSHFKNCNCGITTCTEWAKWFKIKWREIRNTFRKGGGKR